MTDSNLIALAEACSDVRAALGRMLLAEQDSPARADGSDAYRRSLKRLLRIAREEECGLYLEIAGEVATK